MSHIVPFYDPDQPRQAYEPAKEGVHEAAIVDIEDKGLVFQPRFDKSVHKVKLVFELDERNSKGIPIYATRTYTFKLHPKSSLFHDIGLITGQEPTGPFDLDQLMGQSVNVMVKHVHQDGKVFNRIVQVWGGAKYQPSGEYKPWQIGTFPIGRAVPGKSESGKEVLKVYDHEGNELATLWNAGDMIVAANCDEITCKFRDRGDGTIKVQDGSVKAAAA